MIDKICELLVKKIRNKMPEIDDEKAEVITYGIQLIIGEIPKMFILFAISFLLGIGWYTILLYTLLMPYRASSGGFHLKTHLGCIIGTSLFFNGVVFLSKFLVLDTIQKYGLALFALIFGMIMVSKYAPADTENVPILSKKERKTKKILSYIALVITLVVGVIIPNQIISNMLIVGVIVQTMMITKVAYKLTNNKYGYEIYQKEMETVN